MTRALYVVLLLIQISAFSQDLVVTNYTGPTSFSRYEEIAQEITIKNAGIVDISKDFYTGAFLSSDNQWQASDIKLYDSYGYSVPSGSSYTHKASPLVEVTPGTYFLIFKVDHQGTVTETNEANNLLVIPNVVIGAANVDFTLTSFSLDKSTYTQNNLVKPSYVLQNLGTTNAGTYISTDFYLSTDATFSADDKNIGTEIELLKGPDNITSGTDLGFPLPTVANGSYFILAWVDSNYGSQRFAETNESNNKFAIPITIQSSSVDLEISNVLTLSTDGSQARLTIRNNGTTGVSGYSVSAQLVPQGNVPNSNYVTTHMNALNNYLGPHEEKTFDLFFPIHTTTPGTYYPVYYVNYDERVAETYFQNNQRYGAALVIAPPLVSALSFNGMSVAGLVDNTDQQINLNLDLTNTGTDDSFIQYVNLAVKNAQNTVVHSEQTYFYVNFAPGQTSTTALTINLASPLQTGSYSISVSCAYGCYLTPSSKTANFTVSLPQYTLTGTVIGEDGQPITNGKLFLYQDAGSGVIKFIQKVVPYVGPNFTFPVDVNRHTLYFIPDPVQHPEYVPTIYGKTVALQPGNFFTASSNMNVTLEVLKVNSPGAGTGIIHGRVASSASNPAGRETQPLSLEPVQDVPVILISGTGQIVGLTHTNAFGEYQFNNLPRDVYKVVISLELDNASLMDPLRVDITEKNMNVDLVLKPDGTEPTTSQFFLPQTVTFAEFRSYQYNDPAIALDAKSNVELPVEYISSDNSIAEVVNNEIVIKGVGTVIITAKQAGNTFYYPASVNRSLTITKANQALTIGSIPVKIFGDDPFVVNNSSSAGLVTTLSSSDPAIATVNGNVVTIHGAGTVKITVDQAGNNLYHAAPSVSKSLTIEKAMQSITFDELPEQNLETESFELSASSSSGLGVAFESSDESVVSVIGNIAHIHNDGTVTITAKQGGNQNYHAAIEVVRTQIVQNVLAVEAVDLSKNVFPNPTADFLFLQIPGLNAVEVSDVLGRVRKEAVWTNDKIDFSQSEPGVYFVKFFLNGSAVITRVVRK